MGYNNIDIIHQIKLDEKTNTADIYFDINEGTITKIKTTVECDRRSTHSRKAQVAT